MTIHYPVSASISGTHPAMGALLSANAPELAAGTSPAQAFLVPRADGVEFILSSQAEAMASDDPVMKRLLGELADRWLRLRSREAEKPADPLQKWRLKRVLVYVDEHLGEPVSLADMARSAGLSRMYFAARFRAATGLRPHDYILRRRIERAKEMLVGTNEALVDIALEVGFQTQAHFTTVFKKIVGETPGRWRAFSRIPA